MGGEGPETSGVIVERKEGRVEENRFDNRAVGGFEKAGRQEARLHAHVFVREAGDREEMKRDPRLVGIYAGFPAGSPLTGDVTKTNTPTRECPLDGGDFQWETGDPTPSEHELLSCDPGTSTVSRFKTASPQVCVTQGVCTAAFYSSLFA